MYYEKNKSDHKLGKQIELLKTLFKWYEKRLIIELLEKLRKDVKSVYMVRKQDLSKRH